MNSKVFNMCPISWVGVRYPKTRYFNVEYIIYKDECWQHWILFLSTYLSKNICIRQDICQIKTIPCNHWKLTKWWITSSNTVFFSKMNCLNSQFTAPFQDHALCTEFLLRIAHANSKTLKHCINTSKICLSEHKSAKQGFLGQISVGTQT